MPTLLRSLAYLVSPCDLCCVLMQVFPLCPSLLFMHRRASAGNFHRTTSALRQISFYFVACLCILNFRLFVHHTAGSCACVVAYTLCWKFPLRDGQNLTINPCASGFHTLPFQSSHNGEFCHLTRRDASLKSFRKRLDFRRQLWGYHSGDRGGIVPWCVMPCSPTDLYELPGRTCCLHHQCEMQTEPCLSSWSQHDVQRNVCILPSSVVRR